MYTVSQLAKLANVTVRTLHYYDEIGLLPPTKTGDNHYRYYDDTALLRLQQILFYQELGFELSDIQAILDDDNFDVIDALRTHRKALQTNVRRLRALIQTIDSTMMHLTGEMTMSDEKHLFRGFNKEQQKQYEREARLEYGPESVNKSIKRWESYSAAEQQGIMDEGNRIYADIVDAIEAGDAPTSDRVRAILERWHQHIEYFYEPTLEILEGLGDLYNTHPDFISNFKALHPQLPAYLQQAIDQYTDDLETAELEKMLAEERQDPQSS